MTAAAAATLPILALAMPASAQQRVNQDGRALDANTRVGSDGSNDPRNSLDRRDQTVTGNQVVTGNVSGNRSFRGPVPYRDPYEFRGPVAGSASSRFIRDSSAAPTRDAPHTDYGQPTVYYGAERNTPPPPGFRPSSFTGGYFGTGVSETTTSNPYFNPSFQSTSQIFSSSPGMLRPGGGTMEVGGDQNQQPTLLSVSPLSGVIPMDQGMLGRNGVNGAANTLGQPGEKEVHKPN